MSTVVARPPSPPTRRIASLTLISVGGWIPPMRMLYFRGWLAGPSAFSGRPKFWRGFSLIKS